MPTLAEIAESLGPKSVTVGAQTTEARTVDELIKAAQFDAGQEGVDTNPNAGIRFFKFQPPGGGG